MTSASYLPHKSSNKICAIIGNNFRSHLNLKMHSLYLKHFLLEVLMQQGKLLTVTLLRDICTSLMQKISYKNISERFKIAKSTAQKYRKLLNKAQIKEAHEVLLLSDTNLAHIIYGSNSKIKLCAKKICIIKSKPKIDQSKDLYDPNFLELAIKYYENPNIRQSDLFVDYVKSALDAGKSYLKATSFRKKLKEKLALIKGPNVYLHRKHAYGDELQLDWCGETYDAIDADGSVCNLKILVLTWSASYYTYATFVKDYSTQSTVNAIRDGFLFFNRLPQQLLIDNAKALVLKHKQGKEAILQEDFHYFMKRCGILVNANAPFKSNEKSAVEAAVNLIQTRVLTRLKKRLSIKEANSMLKNLVIQYINDSAFRGHEEITRSYLYKKFELDKARYIEGELPQYVRYFPYLKVLQNYHVKVLNNYYSVPYVLEGKYVDVEIYNGKLTVLYDSEIVARHKVKDGINEFVTSKDHMPENHKLFDTIDKIKNADEIIQLTRGLSMELVSFCSLLLTRNNELAEMKKACLYVIQKYQNLTNDNDKKFFNQTIQNVIKRMKIRELSTYALDQEIKLLTSFYSE